MTYPVFLQPPWRVDICFWSPPPKPVFVLSLWFLSLVVLCFWVSVCIVVLSWIPLTSLSSPVSINAWCPGVPGFPCSRFLASSETDHHTTCSRCRSNFYNITNPCPECHSWPVELWKKFSKKKEPKRKSELPSWEGFPPPQVDASPSPSSRPIPTASSSIDVNKRTWCHANFTR